MNTNNDSAVVSESTAALLAIDPAGCSTLDDLVEHIQYNMQHSLPFFSAAYHAEQAEGTEFAESGAAELLALTRAAEALAIARHGMLQAIVKANLHLEGEGLPMIYLGD
ncbi:hypothetical protein [Acidithiobacillus sp.]